MAMELAKRRFAVAILDDAPSMSHFCMWILNDLHLLNSEEWAIHLTLNLARLNNLVPHLQLYQKTYFQLISCIISILHQNRLRYS
jgi:hypothetical protein